MALTSSITDYDPTWPQRYVEAAATLAPIFGGRLVEMHHVGSTAVPGLAAKPEIDVLAVVDASDTPACGPCNSPTSAIVAAGISRQDIASSSGTSTAFGLTRRTSAPWVIRALRGCCAFGTISAAIPKTAIDTAA